MLYFDKTDPTGCLTHWPTLLAVCSTLLLLYIGFPSGQKKKKELPLPPGPPRLPIIGNLHQTPWKYPWRTYQKWHRQYGPIISLQYGTRTVIVLGSHECASALLNARSRIYSSRPRMIVAGEYITKQLHSVLLPYGPRWKDHRRVHGALLGSRAVNNYESLQDLYSKRLVYEMLSSRDIFKQFHQYASRIALGLCYGKQTTAENTDHAAEIEAVLHDTLQATFAPTSLVVDSFPILDYLPHWLSAWKQMGDRVYAKGTHVFTKTLKDAQRSSAWSWSKVAFTRAGMRRISDTEQAYILGVLYEGASHTTAIAQEVFAMACVLYPATVKKAQEELDGVVGGGRLPTFQDIPALPYVTAFVNEVLRWRPITPGGVPHSVLEQDEYMGYRIPKDAIIVANHWSLDLDEKVFPDPLTFKPERWIENPSLPLSAFGFGRRVCPGEQLARQSLLIVFSRLLWAYDILHAEHEGRRVEIDPMAMTQNTTSGPMPFQAVFRVRSPQRLEIIEKEWAASPKDTTSILNAIGEVTHIGGLDVEHNGNIEAA